MLTTEKVAYWYFRLNGFFQMESFIIHPTNANHGQRTDADLIGVRFPFRAERFFDDPGKPMLDDEKLLQLSPGYTEVIIVEVKTNEPCTLNGPWTREEQQNVQRVLAAIGCFEIEHLDTIAMAIYETGLFEDSSRKLRIRLVALGGQSNGDLARKMPKVLQIIWPDILRFIGERLYVFRSIKVDNQQWDEQIKLIQQIMLHNRNGHEFNAEGFINDCLGHLGIGQT